MDDKFLFERVDDLMRHIGMMRHLGARLVRVDEESAEISCTVDERSGNYLSMLHGGAVVALLDTVAFLPGCMLPSGRKLTTEGIETHFFRPAAMGETVTARARILRNGRRMVIVEAEAFNGAGLKMAHCILTVFDLEA